MLFGAPYELQCNASDEVIERNTRINCAREVPRYQPAEAPHDDLVVIVGGGPSLAETWEQIRDRQDMGQKVWALNNSYIWLKERGIQPDAQVILDSRPENAEFLHPDPKVTYYLSQACDPSLFDKLKGCNVVMYHGRVDGTGYTVGIKALYLAANLGFRKFALFGFDSSYREDAHHAFPQALNDNENRIEVVFEGVKYSCAPWMAIQAEEFRQVAISFSEQGAIIVVAGDGLIPAVARMLGRQERVLTAVWDLSVCPPTYDIHTFLAEAEFRRREIGATWIDLVIQPGPIGGFRYDDLPPNYGARVGMLYRVNVGMARLMPSVRNIEILKERRAIEAGDIIPEGWTVERPIHHYGPSYLKRSEKIFHATEAAKAFVQRYRQGKKRPYVTITLRGASHWSQRNSDLGEWAKAASWLRLKGYDVEVIPDTESNEPNLFSWDLDMRLALYEGAVLNLGINNGPTCMWWFCGVPFIIFKMVTEDVNWTSTEFFERFGIKPGPVGESGWLVFEPDTLEVISREVEAYFERSKQKEIVNG